MSAVDDSVYDILVATCGAKDTASWRAQFAYFMAHRDVYREFRFMGGLGFGGKVYFESARGWWVNCYAEDETPARHAMIKAANLALVALGQ